jgi:hypothetical protein
MKRSELLQCARFEKHCKVYSDRSEATAGATLCADLMATQPPKTHSPRNSFRQKRHAV